MNLDIQQNKLFSGHKSSVYALEKISTGVFLSAGGEGWIVEWSPERSDDGQLISTVDAQVFALSYRPEDDQIWAGDMNGGVYVVSRAEKELIFKKNHHPGGTYLLASVNDVVLSSGNDGVLTIWSPSEHYPTESLKISKQRLRAMAVHPTEPLIAIAGAAAEIYFIHTTSWKWVHTIHNAHEGTIFDLAFGPDGKFLYSGAMDAHLNKWDWQEGSLESSVPAHRFTINQMAILKQRGLLLTASRDNSVKFWDLGSLELLKVIDSTKNNYHLNSVNAMIVMDEVGSIVTGSDDRTIRLWHLE